MTYERHQVDVAPPWLQAPTGAAFLETLGSQKDTLTRELKDALYLRGLTDARGRRCPDDALPRHGADRDLERAPLESLSGYRARLAAAWELHSWAGTPYGYAQALALTTGALRGTRFVPQRAWHPDALSLWARFWVVVWSGPLAAGRFTVGPWATVGATASSWDLLVVGSFTVGDGSMVGTKATVAELTEVRRALAKWKNARDRVPALLVADGNVVGLPGLLVGGFVVGGNAITITLDLVVGGFVVGAGPSDDPTGPWFPFVGRSNLV